MAAYATREDVFVQGLPRGSLAERARLIASVDVAANRLELDGHGCVTGTAIQFQVDDGGVLPAPLVVGRVYYARAVTDSESLLEVSETADGAAIDLTDEGTAPFSLFVPLGPTLDALLEKNSRWVDGKLIGHVVPLTAPYPAWVVHAVAVRTAADASRRAKRGEQAASIFAAEEMLLRDVAALVRGTSLRDANATAPSNLARGRTVSASNRDEDVVP